MDDRAHINENGGAYAGLDRYVARKKIVADLEEQGLLAAVKDHTNNVGHCDRCKTVVEPRLSTQWFIKIQAARRESHRRRQARCERQQSHPLHAGELREDLPRVDEEHPRLVHLAPALVGPSHPRMALRRLPQDHRARARLEATPPPARTAAPVKSRRKPTFSTPGSPPACCPSPSSAGRRCSIGEGYRL